MTSSTASAYPVSEANSITPWALWGGIWTLITVVAWARWILSDTLFGPAPILPGDEMASWRLLALRCLEIGSVLIVLRISWVGLLKPWLADRQYGLDAKLLLGGIIGFSADALLNIHELLFAFNSHSFNLGVWTSFMPFYTDGPARYAEALAWGFPMYVYFGVGASYAGCALIAQLRKRYAGISYASALAVTYVVFVISDMVLENIIIRTTQAYMYVKTYESLTLFAGTIYQFPFYESVLSALVCLGFTVIRQSALENPEGLSLVERGAERFDPRIRQLVRTVAVIGATGALFLVAYHLPFNWLGLIGSSVIEPPTYMLPG
jgi:Spirocyclase AveC-like